MLKTILDIFKNRETVSLEELSRKLQISPQLLRAALIQLEHMGRIRRIPVQVHCPRSCAGCKGCQTASSGPCIRWELL